MKTFLTLLIITLFAFSSNVFAIGGNHANANANSASFSGSNSDSRALGLGLANSNSNNTTTVIAAEIPVSTALAPPLVSSNDTCMGSTSFGGQGITFGISIGTTWTDNDCVLRKDARLMANLGAKDLALSLMCAKESVRMAVARLGTPIQIDICKITDAEKDLSIEKPLIVKTRNRLRDSDSFEDEYGF